MKLPLFPLPTMIFTDGIMPLRIFESRYVRMLTLSSEQGFIVCTLDPDRQHQCKNMYDFATRVQMIDFAMLPDGLLGITVQGMETVKIVHVTQEDDGLRFGELAYLKDWPPATVEDKDKYLVKRLQDVFHDFPEFSELYQQPLWNDARWVVRRWLEVLPIADSQKQRLISQSNCQAALRFVANVIAEIERGEGAKNS